MSKYLINQFSVSVTAADGLFLAPNERRIGLVVSAPDEVPVSLANAPVTLAINRPAVAGVGIVLHSRASPLVLSPGEYG